MNTPLLATSQCVTSCFAALRKKSQSSQSNDQRRSAADRGPSQTQYWLGLLFCDPRRRHTARARAQRFSCCNVAPVEGLIDFVKRAK
jgi:hypothetical protein